VLGTWLCMALAAAARAYRCPLLQQSGQAGVQSVMYRIGVFWRDCQQLRVCGPHLGSGMVPALTVCLFVWWCVGAGARLL
jgi:hypothetical protein